MGPVSLFDLHLLIINCDNDSKSSFVKCRTALPCRYGKMFAVIIESSANRRQTVDLDILLYYLPLFQIFFQTQEKRNDGSFARTNECEFFFSGAKSPRHFTLYSKI